MKTNVRAFTAVIPKVTRCSERGLGSTCWARTTVAFDPDAIAAILGTPGRPRRDLNARTTAGTDTIEGWTARIDTDLAVWDGRDRLVGTARGHR